MQRPASAAWTFFAGGLIPHWAKDLNVGFANINAKAEGIESRPAFRDAFWLGEEPADPRQLKSLLVPYPSEGMTCWPVSPRVGNVKNNDPSLIEPVGGAS
jgi:putative SOS response-associated peptidase YedK